jgi:hypothetical protein
VHGVHGVEIIYTSPVTALTDWAITFRISVETGELVPTAWCDKRQKPDIGLL